MAGAWRALVLVAGLAAMACEAQHRPDPQAKIVAQALRFFNAGRQGQPLFGLLEVLPTPRSNSTLRTLVRFRIKETVCLSERQQQPAPQQCAFRDGGEERTCTSAFGRLGRQRFLLVDCSPGPERQQEGSPEQPEQPPAPPPEEAASDIDRSKLPPVARNLYDNARNDIINNLLKNF
ncbi:PREDICTED: 15 kDa protein B-like [Myotis davidii]|uniref:15 kDa protein B-like n=1 Tax=Myotis davidii TaxID=225400 RepID=UPI0007672FAE|nr:PREDICTED: 15 kDa protein B-like [Myotis davidii]